MKVIKRDGHTVDFDRMKIVVAIQKANDAVDPEFRVTQEQIDSIADSVEALHRPRLLVEDIQDMVEQAPYRPKKGTSVPRTANPVPMHWLSRSPARI